jgi:hypothetical protein
MVDRARPSRGRQVEDLAVFPTLPRVRRLNHRHPLRVVRTDELLEDGIRFEDESGGADGDPRHATAGRGEIRVDGPGSTVTALGRDSPGPATLRRDRDRFSVVILLELPPGVLRQDGPDPLERIAPMVDARRERRGLDELALIVRSPGEPLEAVAILPRRVPRECGLR